MQDPRLEGRVETRDHLKNDVDRGARPQRALGFHAIFQRAAGEQFHRNDGNAGDFLASEDVDAVRMVDRGGQLPFAQEPGAVGWIRESSIQHFESNASFVCQMLGFVDFSHPPRTKQPVDPVRPEHLAEFELSGQSTSGRHTASGRGCECVRSTVGGGKFQ